MARRLGFASVRRDIAQDGLAFAANSLDVFDSVLPQRNWAAHYVGNPVVRTAAVTLDLVLRPFPALYSNIYLIGRFSLFA